jgi:hypothetical protein
MTHPKVNNPIVTNTSDSEGEEISDKKYKIMIITMINEMKVDM